MDAEDAEFYSGMIDDDYPLELLRELQQMHRIWNREERYHGIAMAVADFLEELGFPEVSGVIDSLCR